MSDFERGFAPLKTQLDDPDALFVGAQMRDALLALEPLLPDAGAEARLFRELALLEGKRQELSCLDHADRALAAQEKRRVLSRRDLYFMHVACAQTGVAWQGGPRARMHLDRALALCAELECPLDEAFGLRFEYGVYLSSIGEGRHGLDQFEPLLADAEAAKGADSPELANLHGRMADSHAREGREKRALASLDRSIALYEAGGDLGRVVSTRVGYARKLAAMKKHRAARDMMTAAVATAETFGSEGTLTFARKAQSELEAEMPRGIRALFARVFG